MPVLFNAFFSSVCSKLLSLVIFLYIAVLFVCTAMYKPFANDMMNVILLLLPVSIYFFHKKKLSVQERWLVYFGFLIAGYAVFSYFYHPITGHSGPKLAIQAKYMLAFPLLFVLYFCRFTLVQFVMLNCTLCVVAGVYSIYFIVFKAYSLPPGLKLIPFGNLSLLSAIIVLMSLFLFKRSALKLLLFVAFLLGVYASLGSGTRSGWLAFPIMIVFFFIYFKSFISQKGLCIVAAVVLGLFLFVVVNDFFKVRSELFSGFNNTHQYFSAKDASSSMGQRLDMWKAGWLAFKSDPVFGIGLGHTKALYQQLISEGKTAEYLYQYKHFHNSYVENLATKGIVGSLIFLSYIGFLIRSFFLMLRVEEETSRLIGYCGLLIILSFLLFSLTDSFFELTMTATYFIISTTILIYLGNNINRSDHKAML